MNKLLVALEDPRARWSGLSKKDRDAAYDHNGAVADSQAWIEKRNCLSASFRASHPSRLDIQYGDGSGRTAFDLYPAKDADAPCMIFVHGGYWQRNSRENFACVAGGLLAAGWSVAIPGYTLAPEADMSSIVGEIGRAIDWLAKNGSRHGIEGRLFISGWSAGAQLAAIHLDNENISGALAISGVYDLSCIRDTGLNTALQLSDDDIDRFSPLRLAVAQKPMLTCYGSKELECVVHDSLAMFLKRSKAGAPGGLLAVDGADHFSILQELADGDGALVAASNELLAMV